MIRIKCFLTRAKKVICLSSLAEIRLGMVVVFLTDTTSSKNMPTNMKRKINNILSWMLEMCYDMMLITQEHIIVNQEYEKYNIQAN